MSEADGDVREDSVLPITVVSARGGSHVQLWLRETTSCRDAASHHKRGPTHTHRTTTVWHGQQPLTSSEQPREVHFTAPERRVGSR